MHVCVMRARVGTRPLLNKEGPNCDVALETTSQFPFDLRLRTQTYSMVRG